MNGKVQTAMLFAVLSSFLVLIGGVIGGRAGMMFALLIAFCINFVSYWYSDKIVLSMYKAKELAYEDAPQMYRMVEDLSANAQIPMPRLYLVPSQSPNAFATGRNPENAVVAVTEGLLGILSPEELRGVIAHEIAHVANRDILVQTCASVLGAAITYLANILQFTMIFGRNGGGRANPLASLAMIILAPMAAALIQMAISRSREYMADEKGAEISGRPLDLANALGKISGYSAQVPMQEVNPATESMFIISPLSGHGITRLFSTHPPVEERIRRLHEMSM